jgi:hypothetical protein
MRAQFTRRSIFSIGSAAVVGSWSMLLAKDSRFWNTKEPSEWTTDEIDTLITKSPWAKEIKASIRQPVSGDQGSRHPGNIGGPGVGGGRPGGINIPGIGPIGGGGRGGGRSGGGGGLPPATQTELLIRWESAKPILEALRTPLAEAFANQYVISVSGIPNTSQSRDSNEDGIERLKFATHLSVKGKSPVRAETVQPTPGSVTQTILFGFSRSELQFSHDDEVEFATQVARSPIAATFNLKDMTYHGALAV